ncbi:MAG: carboxymuconolactone decarboxylase family protein [Vulcanimicrobiaceae bacterium]
MNGSPTAIPLVRAEDAPLLVRRHFAGGDPGRLIAALAHVPELLEAALPFIGVVYGPSALAERLKELVVLRVSALGGCRYCTAAHETLAAQAGLSDDERTALRMRDAAAPPTFDARERAAFTFASNFDAHPERSLEPLLAHFAAHEIVELGVLAGTTVFLNRFCTAMALA